MLQANLIHNLQVIWGCKVVLQKEEDGDYVWFDVRKDTDKHFLYGAGGYVWDDESEILDTLWSLVLFHEPGVSMDFNYPGEQREKVETKPS